MKTSKVRAQNLTSLMPSIPLYVPNSHIHVLQAAVHGGLADPLLLEEEQGKDEMRGSSPTPSQAVGP